MVKKSEDRLSYNGCLMQLSFISLKIKPKCAKFNKKFKTWP